jgi:selT/selW/selH-like putative selenoprotein
MQSELIKGANGVFDVIADGVLIFSKHHEGRFPDAAEIVRALRDSK